MGIKIEFLQAEHGDCILISYMEKNILIDTGTRNIYYEQNGKNKKYGVLKKKISNLKLGQKIDLLIMTHVDNDHIGGVMQWLKKSPKEFKNVIGKVWFNSGKLIHEYLKFEGLIWSDEKYEMKLKDFNYQYNRFYKNSLKMIFSESAKTSITDGVTFEHKLEEYGLWDRKLIIAGEEYNEFGINFKILSPTKKTLISLLKKWHTEKPDSLTSGSKKLSVKEKQTEDYKELLKNFNIDKFKEDNTDHNGSSIAFILEIEDKKMLFLADAYPSVICDSLKKLGYSSSDKKLEVEFVKIAHHGSQKNTSIDLLKMIKSDKYIVSTNGQKYGHPNKVIFARLVKQNPKCEIYLNYPKLKDKIFLEDDFKDYPSFKVCSTGDLKI